MPDTFNVVNFFADGAGYDYDRRNVEPEEAVRRVREIVHSPAVKGGMIERVIITDSLDCTCLEWRAGEGVVFPEDLKGKL